MTNWRGGGVFAHVASGRSGFERVRTSAVGLPHPVAAVGAHDAPEVTSNQLVLLGALQGDDGAHAGTVALHDLLSAQGGQGHGLALAPRLTCEQTGDEMKR